MKKRIMRLFPVLLALVMVFGSSLTVFAEINYKCLATKEYFITIDGQKMYYVEDCGLNKINYSALTGNNALMNYNDYVVAYKSDSVRECYYILFFPENQKVFAYHKNVSSGFDTSLHYSTVSLPFYFYVVHDFETDAWSCFYYTTSSDCWLVKSSSSTDDSINLLSDMIVYSTVDLWTGPYENGTVFLSAPTSILVTVVKPETMKGALEQVLMILPIGLACLVGYLALRKALAVLRSLLHQA